MERTVRSLCAASTLVALLALSAAIGHAAPPASGATVEPPSSTLSESPTAFAERLAASHAPATGFREGDSLREALELIVLAAVCALGAALYSSVSDQRDGTSKAARRRRRRSPRRTPPPTAS